MAICFDHLCIKIYGVIMKNKELNFFYEHHEFIFNVLSSFLDYLI